MTEIVQAIIQLVSNVGFPIAMCFAMAIFIKNNTDSQAKNHERYKDKEIDIMEQKLHVLEEIRDLLKK